MAKHSKRDIGSQESEALAGNPAYEQQMQETINLVVPEGYVDVQISFPPYWKPEIGKGFRGKVLYRDERVGTFHRYVIQSSIKLDCRKGPVDDGEVITVSPGMNFSIGVYAALPLERFFGVEVAVIATGSRRLPANEASEGRPRDLWEFRTLVAPEVMKKLESNREEDIRFLQESQRAAHREMLKELARGQVQRDPSAVSRAMSGIM